MAADYTQKPERVPCDSQIKSETSLEDEKNLKPQDTLREDTVSTKKEVKTEQTADANVESGLVNHANSSSSPVESESVVSKTKTEESTNKPVPTNKLEMEWSDAEEESGQYVYSICEKSGPEANGAVTPERNEENVSSEAGRTLKREEEPKLQDGEAVLKHEIKKRPAMQPPEPPVVQPAGITLKREVEPKLQDGETVLKSESKKRPAMQPAGPAASEEADAKQENDEEKEEGGEEEEAAAGEGPAEQVVKKQRTLCLECRDCGKCFTRRETYNLHRHFHAHQDEQASLTCKECGLTFQHRSGLLKHRNDHKEKAESGATLVSPVKPSKSPHSSEEKNHSCEHCGKKFEALAKLRVHNCKEAPEKPYRCPLCRKEFQYRVSITAHMQTHSLESPFRCLECNKGFQSPQALRIHQGSHAALKPFSCPECGMVFRHRSVMEDHRRRHAVEQPFHCTICGKCFKYASMLHQHQYLHTGKKPFRCHECGKAFAFSQNLRAHQRQHQKNTHCCPDCTETFSDEAALQEHIESHEKSNEAAITDKENANHGLEQKPMYNCPLCAQVYYRPADLRVHMLVHEAEYEGIYDGGREVRVTFPCSQCQLTFTNEASLKAHQTLNHNPNAFTKKDNRGLGTERRDSMPGSGIYGDQIDKKPLKCLDCGRGFRHRSVLELHMRVHNKDKPYRCTVCGKSFKFSSYLQQHVIIHTGKKPYKCPDCGKDFAFYQNMKTHHRLHQQKPFRCTQCRKGYSDEAQLKIHLLSHSGDKPHKCKVCDKSFGLAYLLRDHMNTHTGERPHRCAECGKSFQWLSSLLVHQKIHVRKHVPSSHADSTLSSSDQLRGERGAGAPTTAEGLRSDWPRYDGPQRTTTLSQPSTYAAPMSQGPECQDRMPPRQQSLSFGRQPEPLELSAPSTGNSTKQPLPWKLDPQQREQQQRLTEAPAKPAQQQWQLQRPSQVVQNVGWISLMPQPMTTQIVQQAQQQHQQQQHAQSEAGSHLVQPQSTSRTDASHSVLFTRPHPPPLEETLAWTAKTSPVVPHSQSPSKLAGAEHDAKNSPPSVFWGSTGAPVPPPPPHSAGSTNPSPKDQESKVAVHNTQSGLPCLPPMDDKLWNYKIPTVAPHTASDQTGSVSEKQPLHQQSPALATQPQPLALNQTTMMDPPRIPPGTESTLWTFQTTSVIPKALGSQDLPSSATEQLPQQLIHLQQQKLQLQQQQQQLQLQQQQQMQQQQQLQLQQQQLQIQLQQQQQLQLQQQQQLQLQQKQNPIASTWVSSPTSSQMNPVAIQYGPPRFSHGDSPAVWGFQATPAGTQTLMAGPIQQSAVRAQTQLPLMAGPQLIINQPTTFLSPQLRPLPPLGLPAPHPLHSVAVNQIPRPAPPPPQNIFFSPQGLLGDRAALPQTRPFSPIAPRTELPNLTGRLPFNSDRRQCVVCGCTFAQDVELQMHYMQHAKGEI